MPDEGGVDEELAPSASSKFYLNNAPYTARIKRMMQSDEDVGRVAKATPILISKALDVFLANLVKGAVQLAQERGAKALTAAHMKAHIQSDPLLDFCLEAVSGVADLPSLEECALQSPKASRKRAKPSDREAGEGRRQAKAVAQPAKQVKQEAGVLAEETTAASSPVLGDGNADSVAAPAASVDIKAEGEPNAGVEPIGQPSTDAEASGAAPSAEVPATASDGEGCVQPEARAIDSVTEPVALAVEPVALAAEPLVAEPAGKPELPAAGSAAESADHGEGSHETPAAQAEFAGYVPGIAEGGGGGGVPGLDDDEEDYDDDG